MTLGLKKEIIKLALHTLLALIVGLLIGHPISTLLVGGASYLYLSYRKITALFTWINNDEHYPPSELTGFWGEIADAIYKDRKKLKRIQNIQEQALKRVDYISSAMQDGILILNSEHELAWWNPSAKTMLALNEKDRFKALSNLVRHPIFQDFLAKEQFDKSCIFAPTNRNNLTFEVAATYFGPSDAELLIVFRDITRITQLEQMRKDFVGNISHELRTPLTVINGYIDTMETLLPEEKWGNIMSQMRNQSNRMTALTDDLTMLSKLEADNYQPNKEEIDLTQLISVVVEDAQHLATVNHTVTAHTEKTSAVTITGNYQQLYSAISNLVVNAIKHNPEGCFVDTYIKTQQDNITITIEDTGKGIAAKHLPRLTERFYRTDTDRNSSTGGTGLGLAIVKHVLQHHNGELDIESTEGVGSKFIITIKI